MHQTIQTCAQSCIRRRTRTGNKVGTRRRRDAGPTLVAASTHAYTNSSPHLCHVSPRALTEFWSFGSGRQKNVWPSWPSWAT